MSSEPLQGRVRVPETVGVNQPFELRTLVRHPMETGYRRNYRGEPIERNIIHRVQVWLNNSLAVDVEPGPAVAANPYLGFWLSLEESAEVRVEWSDDTGRNGRWTGRIEVVDGA